MEHLVLPSSLYDVYKLKKHWSIIINIDNKKLFHKEFTIWKKNDKIKINIILKSILQ